MSEFDPWKTWTDASLFYRLSIKSHFPKSCKSGEFYGGGAQCTVWQYTRYVKVIPWWHPLIAACRSPMMKSTTYHVLISHDDIHYSPRVNLPRWHPLHARVNLPIDDMHYLPRVNLPWWHALIAACRFPTMTSTTCRVSISRLMTSTTRRVSISNLMTSTTCRVSISHDDMH